MTVRESLRDWYINNLETRIAINKAAIKTIEELISLREDGLLTAKESKDIWDRIGW